MQIGRFFHEVESVKKERDALSAQNLMTEKGYKKLLKMRDAEDQTVCHPMHVYKKDEMSKKTSANENVKSDGEDAAKNKRKQNGNVGEKVARNERKKVKRCAFCDSSTDKSRDSDDGSSDSNSSNADSDGESTQLLLLRACLGCRDFGSKNKLGRERVIKAYYCGRECQKGDWERGHAKYHRELKTEWEKFQMSAEDRMNWVD